MCVVLLLFLYSLRDVDFVTVADDNNAPDADSASPSSSSRMNARGMREQRMMSQGVKKRTRLAFHEFIYDLSFQPSLCMHVVSFVSCGF